MNLLMIIFGLIAILAVVGTVQERNILSIIFNLGAAVVFGGFTIATLVFQGYPPGL